MASTKDLFLILFLLLVTTSASSFNRVTAMTRPACCNHRSAFFTSSVRGGGNAQFEMNFESILTIRPDGSSALIIKGSLQNALMNAAIPCEARPKETLPDIKVSKFQWRDSAGRCVRTIALEFPNLTVLGRFFNNNGAHNFQQDGDTIKVTIGKGPYDPSPNLRGDLQFIVRMPTIDGFSPANGVKTRIANGEQVSWRYGSEPEIPVLQVSGHLRLGSSSGRMAGRPYVGCWSRKGNVLYVSLKTIQTAVSFKALNYEEFSRIPELNLYMLKLSEVDQSKEFQPFVLMEVVDDYMKANSYTSYEDRVTRMSLGSVIWIRDHCENVLPKLKGVGTSVQKKN